METVSKDEFTVLKLDNSAELVSTMTKDSLRAVKSNKDVAIWSDTSLIVKDTV